MVNGDKHCSQHQRAGAPELHGQQWCVPRPRPSPVTLTPPRTAPRVLFTLVCSSARDIQRYSAMGRAESEFVVQPGCCWRVECKCDAGHGLTTVQLTKLPQPQEHAHVTSAPPSPSLPPPPALHISNRRCFVHPTHLHPPPSRSPTGEFNLIKCSKCCGIKKAVKYKRRDG
jgi:hypothetical protein